MRSINAMPDLNKCLDRHVIEEEGYDQLVICNLGDAISFTNVAEDGVAHNVVVSLAMAEALMSHTRKIIE